MALEPEWVQVWWWARNLRNPRELREFPQQSANAELGRIDYERLLAEWVAAGRPKSRQDVLLPDLDAILG